MGRIQKKGQAGAAANYISRNLAIKKLQISLAQFRRLCIIKGIYPREPRSKKKVGRGSTAPKTFYFRKDIQFLLHEPILHKLREIRAHQLKINKAVAKQQWAVVKQLDESRPEYRLDHVVKERYPSFSMAVRDLDDALSMLALFATLPTHSRVIKQSIIKTCARLVTEFQHYVMITGRLKKVFVSIKGIYYQADIGGSDVTWIVPHQFSQDSPRDVDFRIMATFLDLYETLVGFINFKLYLDLNLAYPPRIVDDESSSGLSGLVVEPAVTGSSVASVIIANAQESGTIHRRITKRDIERRVKSLNLSEKSTDAPEEQQDDDSDEEDEDNDTNIPFAIVTPIDASEIVPSLKDAAKIITGSTSHKLFHSCVFYLNREVSRQSLEFVIKSFGGKVGWPETSGSGSAVAVTDTTITHHIVDRPLSNADKAVGANNNREYLQPQWIYDCVNAGKILKTVGYHVGETLPPHLSPFGGGLEGYVPPEASASSNSAIAVSKGHVDTLGNESEEKKKAGESDEDKDEDEDDEDDDDVEDDGEEEDILKGPLDVSVFHFIQMI
ncbi:mRNA-binding ribosome synthesis protein nop7 [Physocladia obscura]|uniref:Pescadillo homolog n=1 Tax=Physocladia obscura TaxID=109957 RepID=A0AAD5XB41_9FUNG|nr:mRNA-binding ribosome synthesis protein nop7 [Physocladia obscura]